VTPSKRLGIQYFVTFELNIWQRGCLARLGNVPGRIRALG